MATFRGFSFKVGHPRLGLPKPRLGCKVNGMRSHRHPAGYEPGLRGFPSPQLKERFDRLAEGLELITSLLVNEYTDFTGRYYHLGNARCEPKSLQHVRWPDSADPNPQPRCDLDG